MDILKLLPLAPHTIVITHGPDPTKDRVYGLTLVILVYFELELLEKKKCRKHFLLLKRSWLFMHNIIDIYHTSYIIYHMEYEDDHFHHIRIRGNIHTIHT